MPVIRQRLQFQYFIMRMQLTALDHIFNCIRPVIMHFTSCSTKVSDQHFRDKTWTRWNCTFLVYLVFGI